MLQQTELKKVAIEFTEEIKKLMPMFFNCQPLT